jgi:hypothetical protein
MPKMKISGSFKSLSDLNSQLGSNYFLYQLSGQFGNQLLGLSTAHLISKELGRRPLIDISRVTQFFGEPLWRDYLDSGDWFDVFDGTFSVKFFFDKPHDVAGKLREGSELEGPFRGFSAHWEDVERSGFLTGQDSPFRIRSELSHDYAAVTFRRGDYWNFPNLGVLPTSYYKNALHFLVNELDLGLPLRLYSQDASVLSSGIFDKYRDLVEFGSTQSVMQDWLDIRRAKWIIAANSTFSYSAGLRSTSNLILPRPFYLKESNFCSECFYPPNSSTISFTQFPKLRYQYLQIQRKVRRVFSET